MILLGVVLAAVQLDDQAGMEADEIRDVTANGHLAPEFVASEPFGTQAGPKLLLLWRLFAAQFTGTLADPDG